MWNTTRTLNDLLAVIIFVYYIGIWFFHFTALIYGKFKLHKKINKISEHPYPGVSIIKPLMGIEICLSGNLESFFTMDYPKYELLFCVEDKKDPAINIVNSLIEKYPNVDTTLFVGGSVVGVNPKINNMQASYEHAKYKFIMISDSGIRMKEDTLRDMMNHMRENVALVHQLPFTYDRNGFAASLEKVYFGTAQARMYLAADLFNVTCHTGMSSLIRKDILEEIGGLKAFACYLAEDYFIAKSFKDKGWRICISSQPALQNSGICNVKHFCNRLNRWAKLRIAMLPFTIIMEPLSECLILGAIAAWSFNHYWSIDPVIFYLLHILIWFFFDCLMLSTVQNKFVSFKKFEFLLSWIFRELIGPYLFFSALCFPVINWRIRKFKLRWGGFAEEIN